jgi:hypothetical protein
MQNLHYQLARYADIAAAEPIGCTLGDGSFQHRSWKGEHWGRIQLGNGPEMDFSAPPSATAAPKTQVNYTRSRDCPSGLMCFTLRRVVPAVPLPRNRKQAISCPNTSGFQTDGKAPKVLDGAVTMRAGRRPICEQAAEVRWQGAAWTRCLRSG